jgi:hypothetical protein
VLQCPDSWTDILVRECEAWGDDGAFVMNHVVIRNGSAVTFERPDRGSA